MMENNHSIEELIHELSLVQQDWADKDDSLEDVFMAWKNHIGFDGSIWAGKDEWLNSNPYLYE